MTSRPWRTSSLPIAPDGRRRLPLHEPLVRREHENWPLADFYLGETEIAPPLGGPPHPIRKDDAGQEINLGNILEAFENSQLPPEDRPSAAEGQAGFQQVTGGPDRVLRLPQGC